MIRNKKDKRETSQNAKNTNGGEKQKTIESMKAKRKKILFNCIKYLCSNGISVKDYNNKNEDIFPEKPFELRNSEEFFNAIKFNNYELVKQALKKNKRYIDQFDYMKQTPFHWAAKLGYDKILDLLLKYSKRCNVYDKKLRTPIYIAALNNQKKCVELLLQNGGNPYISDLDGKKPEDISTNLDIKILLQTTSEKTFNEMTNQIIKKAHGF